MKFQDVSRTKLAAMFDRVRQELALGTDPKTIEHRLAAGSYGPPIDPLLPCGHDNAHPPDHCHSCAPRWGWVGPFVRAR